VRLPIAAFLVGLGWGAQAAAQTAARPALPPAPPAPPASDLYVYTIAPRDTLIALGRVLLASPARWREVQRLNHVRNPRRLRPGRPLAIPLALLRTIPATAQVLWLRGTPRVRLVDGTNAVALIGSTIGEGARLTTQAGEAIGPLDVLSDTMGVDFGPYLARVLHDVRENWYRIIPESARAPLMKKGKVSIEFAILKDGQVAGLQIVGSSGDIALDRAAYGGITASKPFPPLPTEFGGQYLALRFHFYYNPERSEIQ